MIREEISEKVLTIKDAIVQYLILFNLYVSFIASAGAVWLYEILNRQIPVYERMICVRYREVKQD